MKRKEAERAGRLELGEGGGGKFGKEGEVGGKESKGRSGVKKTFTQTGAAQ